MWNLYEGASLQMFGVLRLIRSKSFRSSFTPASVATASVCRTVLLLPPIAMSSANKNADKMLETLNLEYNRSRQSAITTELLDLASGRFAGDPHR